MRLRISTMPAGSRPLVGSSRMSNEGSDSRAAAMPSRCFIPNEYRPNRSLARSANPTRCNTVVNRCGRQLSQTSEDEQVVPTAQRRIEGRRFDQRADMGQIGSRIVDVSLKDPPLPIRGTNEPEQHPDGGGFSGTIGTHKATHGTVRNRQVQIVDDLPITELLRQACRDDGQSWCIGHGHGTQTVCGDVHASKCRNSLRFLSTCSGMISAGSAHPFGEYQRFTVARENGP